MKMEIILDTDEFHMSDVKKASIYNDNGNLVIDIDGCKLILNPDNTIIHLEES